MACEFVGNTIICGRGRKTSPPCVTCRKPSTKLCDYPVTTHATGTCDRAMCDQHSKSAGLNIDHCLVHAEFVEKQKNANS